MAKPDKLSNEQKEIIRAQNDALLRLPADVNDRLKLYADARLLRAKENDQIAQVKKESGLRDHEKRLVEDYKIVPQVLKIMATLAKMPATARAAACRQLLKAIDDEQFIYRDMFDEGAIGNEGSDLEGRAVFDATSEGRRRGGDTAQPRSTEDMAKSNVVHLPTHKPTPGIPLDEALAKFEEANAKLAAYRAEHPAKPGAKKKELRDLEVAVAEAEAAHKAAAAAADPLADKPEAKPGEVTEGLREGAGESEQHIRDAVAEKPKRASRKKAGTEPTAPVEQQASADEDDDTIDVDGPAAPPAPPAGRPDAIGAAPSTYRAG